MQEGSLVECLAHVTQHRWRDLSTCKETLGPNNKEMSTVSGFDRRGNLLLLEYPEPKTSGYGRYFFREIQPPMDVTAIVEEAMTECVPQ